MSGLLSGDQGFDNEKAQTLYLYLTFDLSEHDYFKVVVDRRLEDKVDSEPTPNCDVSPEIESPFKDLILWETNVKAE